MLFTLLESKVGMSRITTSQSWFLDSCWYGTKASYSYGYISYPSAISNFCW